jgi:hypothetical protein
VTTPLSAGSKTLSPLLHLKTTFDGGFYFSYSFRMSQGLVPAISNQPSFRNKENNKEIAATIENEKSK